MSKRDLEYSSELAGIKRSSYTEYPAAYGSEHDIADRDFLSTGMRHSLRSRADSIVFTPQDAHGAPTHSETGDSAEEQPYFNTNYHQFESSFRTIRGRERAPLAPRLFDMRRVSGVKPNPEQLYRVAEEQQATNIYDSEVELRELPPEQQELAIIEDILSLMLGVSGRYISFRHKPHSTKWRHPMLIEDALIAPMWINSTLAQMANKVLSLVLMHKRVEYFTAVYARRQAGVVNQALCAAIQTVLKDYYALVFTLETLVRTSTDTSPYTLQQLWYHVYPSTQTFERLTHLIGEIQAKDLPQEKKTPEESNNSQGDGFASLVDKNANPEAQARNVARFADDDDDFASSADESDYEEDEPSEKFVVRGGYTLNVISDMIKMRGGDAATRRMYEFLLSKASVPFLQMLKHWLHTGELEDNKPGSPGEEFMVASVSDGVAARTFVDSEAMIGSDTRSPPGQRKLGFISISELTPAFLRPYSVKILRTGEYLNILRACGVDLRALDILSDSASALTLDAKLSESTSVGVPVPRIRPAEVMSSATAELYSQQLSMRSSEQIADEDMCNEDEQEEETALLNDWLNPQTLMRGIDQAYLRANQALLDILLKDSKLMDYMGAVKRYLLFEKSDFLTHFLDLAKFEMNRQAKDMSANRLQSFLDIALLNPASVAHDDPLKDIVKVSMETSDLLEMLQVIASGESVLVASDGSMALQSAHYAQRNSNTNLTGSSAFLSSAVSNDSFTTDDIPIALRLNIPFPLTIVLDKVALSKYKALSRLLLALKQTEQNLVSSWLINLKLEDPRVDAGLSGKDASKAEAMRRDLFLKIQTMRHRMLISIQQILYYCFWDVIEPQWDRMIRLMKDAKTVDELCKVHIRHLDVMFQQCGLTATKLPKAMVELLKRANKFTYTVNKLVSSRSALFKVAGDSSSTARNTVSGRLLAEMNKSSNDPDSEYAYLKKVYDNMDTLDKYWVKQLKSLLSALNHYAHKFEVMYLNLAVRLDCNGGYGDDGGGYSGR
ncbi:gamma tubulin complex Spc97/GCP2 subunit Alp4 [Coemansia sp. RSA 1939]|nr:gamma tubulin complex Spc97/GCP2 subunit Alp4 [Coemansia sp. RSA 1939]KAJ2614222.1 gamma tubulin complex Spc97/GCP2 subunit Alp4 [Coemansia sp. RSA 1804]